MFEANIKCCVDGNGVTVYPLLLWLRVPMSIKRGAFVQ